MTTTADALEVMTLIAACHRRTAPRMDDREATIAAARVWSDLFSVYNLDLPDLLAAVKKRALTHADAPEPAEIIRFARDIRRDRAERNGPSPEYLELCASKAEGAKRRLDVMVEQLAEAKGIDRA